MSRRKTGASTDEHSAEEGLLPEIISKLSARNSPGAGAIEKSFETSKARFLREWMEILRFPSVSADRDREKDCFDCARWLASHLRGIGFKSRLLATPSKPVVYAERKGVVGLPVVLFYAHYDVQPVDPVQEWKTPPFEPALRQGRVYARGAQDCKGQLMYAINAMETLIRRDAPIPTIKIIVEGEEENGSRGIAAILNRYRDLLKADVLMVTDIDAVSSGAPTIVMGLRGVFSLTVELSGPSHDLHSGTHGGVAPNPAMEMARLIATLHNPDGSIAVKGFYDGVGAPSSLELALARKQQFNAKAYEAVTGVPPLAGELRFAPPERLGFRPTIEVNGVHSGYGGEGSKTIIPAKAVAKLSSRIVSGQEPDRCLKLIEEHLKKHAPRGLCLSITEKGGGGPAVRLNPDSLLLTKARDVLDRLGGGKTVFMWEGASIPIVSALAGVSGAEPLLIGFGNDRDRIHAPNESFSLEQFRRGYLYVALMLLKLAESR